MTQGKGFGLGKMKQLAAAFQKAQQMQENAKKLQEELEQMEIPGSSADGSVVVFMTGNQEPLRVEINEAAAAKSAPELSQLVTEAMKNAYFVSKQHMEQKMEKLTSELNIPGM